MPGAPELVELIHAEVRREGPMTFARFMDLALNHPSYGYYRTRDRFGTQGDFYTAEQLQPVFGELVAAFVEDLTNRAGSPDPFHVVELGSGRGEMQAALARWQYRPFDWNTPPLPEPASGLVLANEFFDALPVHILRKEASGWAEVVITGDGANLGFASAAPSSAALLEYADRYGGAIETGGLLEAALDVEPWLQRAAALLREGHLLVIDYGYEARELKRFPAGTLLAYHQHRALGDLLSAPGGHDITAHVNFTWLCECAVRSGFELESKATLAQWILTVWDEDQLAKRWGPADERWRLQYKHLLFGMGAAFHVLHFRRPYRP